MTKAPQHQILQGFKWWTRGELNCRCEVFEEC